MTRAPPPPDPRPAAGLLHPLPLVAMGILALNDHWGKTTYPGLLTGKLSDFAGLAFFPLLLQAGWEVATRRAPSRAALGVAAVVTGTLFTLIKVAPVATQGWAWTLGFLQWPVRFLLAGAPHAVPVAAVTDPTDLVALPALFVAVWAGWARTGDNAPAGR